MPLARPGEIAPSLVLKYSAGIVPGHCTTGHNEIDPKSNVSEVIGTYTVIEGTEGGDTMMRPTASQHIETVQAPERAPRGRGKQA